MVLAMAGMWGGGGREELLEEKLQRQEWNGNKEYWGETPLDMQSWRQILGHSRMQGNLDHLEFKEKRPTLQERGVIVDSYGPIEGVASSKQREGNSFVVDRQHTTARNVAARHSGERHPLHPKGIPSDQFMSEEERSAAICVAISCVHVEH